MITTCILVATIVPLTVKEEETGISMIISSYSDFHYFIFEYIRYISHYKIIFLEKPYSCVRGYCSSFYGNYILGTNDSVAKACEMDQSCKAFRYSSQHGFGYLCYDLDQKRGYDDWVFCGGSSGEIHY